MTILRYVFATIAVLFVAGVVYQVFLAGMAVFGAGEWATHVDFGYGVAWVPLLLLLLARPARVGRRLTWLSLVTLLVAQVQTSLPLLAGSLPVIAALHPVNAMLVFGLGVVVARRALSVLPTAPRAAAHAPEAAAAERTAEGSAR